MSKKKKSKKLKKAAKSRLAKSEKKLLSASDALLTISVETGKKWHKLFKHSITTTEPLLEKQIDMFFDTTDAVREQLEEGADRFKKMLGVKEDIGDIVQKKISQNKIAKKLAESANKLIAVVDESGIKKSLEKGAVKIKMEITERLASAKKTKKKSAKKKSSKKKSTAKKEKSTTTKKKASTAKKEKPTTTKKKASTAKKEKSTTAKRAASAAKSKTNVKPKTTVAKRRGRPVGSKKKTADAKKGISGAASPSAKSTAKSKSSTAKKVVAKKVTTTGAKRGPKPGAKRGPKPKTTAATKNTNTGVKRGPKPGAKRKTTAKKITTTTAASKRGRKPKQGRAGYDDLKKVMGVGAKMEKILNEKGIKTYNDLKSIGVSELQTIINSAGGYYQSYKPQMWKSEAALAAAGKFDQMKSGRR